MYRPFLFLFFSLSASASLWAQQQTPLTLAEAEDQFQMNNLMLIAERLNVDIAEAEVVQARLFQNPVISFEQNIYNRTNGKYFDMGRQGEQIVEIEQLISIAGQRNNNIRLEKINRDIAGYAFEELLLTLRSQLREKFITLYYIERSLQVYEREIDSIGQLLEYYKSEAQKDNISLFEKTRLEAMLLHLRMEKNESEDEVLTLRHELCLFTGISPDNCPVPVFDEQLLAQINMQSISIDELQALLPERADLKQSSAAVRASETNVRLQRSLAFPEVNIKGIYDRAGNFCNDYFALGLNFTLPVFNRNQGNRKAARIAVQQQTTMEQFQREQAYSELTLAFCQLKKAALLYQNANHQLEHDFSQIMDGVNENFLKRNINMIEFIDYYQTCKEANLQLFDLRKNLALAADALNTAAGHDVILFTQITNP